MEYEQDEERDYEESISSVRGLMNALIISALFWVAVLSASAAFIGAIS